MNWVSLRFFKRHFLRSLLLILILAILLSLAAFGFGQQGIIEGQVQAISDTYYTTVKIDDRSLASRAPIAEDFDFADNRPDLVYQAELEEKLRDFHENSADVKIYDTRKAATAILPSHFLVYENAGELKIPVTSEDDRSGGYTNDVSLGQVVGQCVYIEYIEPFIQRRNEVTMEPEIDTTLLYDVYFLLDHVHSEIEPVAGQTKYLKLRLSVLTETGEMPFSQGHDYRMVLDGAYLQYSSGEEAEGWDLKYTISPQLDSMPQFFLYGVLLGAGEEFGPASRYLEAKQLDDSEAQLYWIENYARKPLPTGFLDTLETDFDKAMITRANRLPSVYYPIWDLSDELDNQELAAREADFALMQSYATLAERAFPVIETADPNLLYEWNDQLIFLRNPDASREFLLNTDEPVCYVSSLIANRYGLSIGDRLEMGLVNSPSVIEHRTVDSLDKPHPNANLDYIPITRQLRTEPFSTLEPYLTTEVQSLPIAGIYDYSPELLKPKPNTEYLTFRWFDEDIQLNNTIIIQDPDRGIASSNIVTPLRNEEIPYSKFTYSENAIAMISVRLKNGQQHIDNYRQEMREAGLEEYIIEINDHGFLEVEKTLLAAQADVNRQTLITTAASVLFLVLYFIMLIRFTLPDVRRMYVLGADRKNRFRTVFSLSAQYWLVASLLAILASVVLGGFGQRNLELQANLAVTEKLSLTSLVTPVLLLSGLVLLMTILVVALLVRKAEDR